jgi:DNA-binding transcriptional LysR family regulator
MAVAHRLGVRLEPRLEAASATALKQAVARDGFTILSSLAVEQEQRSQTLHVLRLDGSDMPDPGGHQAPRYSALSLGGAILALVMTPPVRVGSRDTSAAPAATSITASC